MKNKQQIIHIHGGTSFKSYEDFLLSLNKREYNPYRTNKNRWNRNYYNFLDENYFEVFRPDMPNAFNARYNEWKIWFEKLFQFYHSEDDKYVPISESKKYHAALPGSHFHKFHDRGHFLGETFPELFNNIKE